MINKILIIAIIALMPQLCHSFELSGEGSMAGKITTLFDSNCVGKWALANTTWTDTCGTNHLSETGDVTAGAGHYGGSSTSAYFSPTSTNYLDVADNAELSITGSVTMSAWINFTGMPTGSGIVGKGTSTSYDLLIINKYIWCRIRTSGDVVAKTPSTISADAWHHLACVYNGTDIRIYVDGSLASGDNNPKSQTGNISDDSNHFFVGTTGSPYTAYIDDVALWSRALSADEILKLSLLGEDFQP